MKILFAALFFLLVLISYSNCQIYSNKVVGKKNTSLSDNIKIKPYPYALPVWGAKAAKLGFDLPYSAGMSMNYFWQQSDMIIENLFVGFNNGPMYNLQEIVRFSGATATASAINFRPDVWVFPFLNVYGIFSKAKTSTEINAGLWVPTQSSEWQEITSFSSKANFDATSMGFGLTPTIGVGGGFLAIDMNFNWTDISALNKPVFSFIVGPRLGKSFKFKKPESSLAVWAGGFRVMLNSSTAGSLKLSEVLPIDGLQAKVDNGIARVDASQIAIDSWWNDLSSLEQKNPVNIAKYATANRVLGAAGSLLNGVYSALSDDKSATVQYSLNKRPKQLWNFIIGSQYQLNKHFMIRAEYGFLASRQQFMTGLQYRFGL
jgi:hypothetical protein